MRGIATQNGTAAGKIERQTVSPRTGIEFKPLRVHGDKWIEAGFWKLPEVS